MDYMHQLGSLSLGSRLKRLSDTLMSEVTHIYNEAGISLNPSYFPLLTLIHHQGPQGITQASEMLGVSHPAISKLADKMIREGYLIKSPHPQDKRASRLGLSDKADQVIEQAKPVWAALQQQLHFIEARQSLPLLDAVNEFEQLFQEQNFKNNVLQALNREAQNIEIINWAPQYKDDFKRLNMNWLNTYFNGELTETDRRSLNSPEDYYLARGGYLFFARQADKITAALALRLCENNSFEISKMAVDPQAQGLGIGRQLLLTALNKARRLHADKVWLETNSRLTRAVKLYSNFGFTTQEHPKGKSSYPRADMYMELQLTKA
ncbi:bifunctional helix-turn-helix transcriptional regulator/GNAT family N-acetyltransferase [Psychromonas aquimarina]|uniref:bifunctional helix-turn-helix transcriptional regulator/GNAT family N-acetyltransferase n=1 Tax=Psychromonas aquimarina TaxID=444919 RepID=UPI00041CE6F3|nr:bifunctional helix-turn-helix transcriptional regulator/GNAT family N-acetyltransferase [Psychromonas aquimarina]